MSYLTQLFERAKALSSAETKHLVEEERNMRQEAQADPSKALYYDVLCRAYLSAEKNSKALGIKLVDWHLKQDKKKTMMMEEKKMEEKKMEEKKMEEKKMEEKKMEEKKMEEKTKEQEEKVSTDKAGDTTGSESLVFESNTPPVKPTAAPEPPKSAIITDFRGYPNHNPITCHPSCSSDLMHPWMPCPLRAQANKRAAEEALEKEREAKRAARRGQPFRPRLDDWQCRCKYWNSKFWFNCRCRKKCDYYRSDQHIIKRQAAGEGIEDHPPIKAKWDGDWCCTCSQWNRAWTTYCFRCIKDMEECWDYTAKNGVDGELLPPPAKEPDDPSEASKRQKFFATHDGHWKPQSRRYGGKK